MLSTLKLDFIDSYMTNLREIMKEKSSINKKTKKKSNVKNGLQQSKKSKFSRKIEKVN